MDKFLLTGDVRVKPAEKDGCCVYRFRNETGEGTITIYEVFPGVILSYNDFHIRYYDSEFKPDRNLFCIDHCREGRLEYPAADDAYSYVEAGDLKLDRRFTHTGHFEMPLSHYHGAMVSFDMDIFGELYAVPEKIRRPYFKIKILELLLYLEALELPESPAEKPYFYRSQVEKAKAVQRFLTGHMDENFTQEELSKRYPADNSEKLL